MRIGINTLFLVPGDVGGTEVYLRQNLLEMSAQFPEHTFVIFTNKENDDSFRSDLNAFGNVEYRLIRVKAVNRPVRIVAEQSLLPLKAVGAELDVMWSPGYTAPFFCPCPQVVTIHDLQYLSYPEDMKWSERCTLDVLVKNGCRRCDHIIAVSRFAKDEITQNKFAGEDKISVIYEGVDPGFNSRNSVSWSGVQHDIPVDAPYILCVAHTYPHKKVHLLVDAFGMIQDKIPHHLMLVGKPRRGEEELNKALDRIEDTSRIHRYKGLEYPLLKQSYQKADLFVLPSVYEGFGLPVLEAMMAEVPVLTTSCASLPEVGGEFVFYVNEIDGPGFASSILEILGMHGDLRRERCRRAIGWAEKFSWKASAAETMQVLAASCKAELE